MTTENMLWEFLPPGLKGLFNIVRVEKLSGSFHVWLDEIRQKSTSDNGNYSIVGKVGAIKENMIFSSFDLDTYLTLPIAYLCIK